MTEQTVSIFSLNLRFGLADDGPNSWSIRKSMYPTLIERYLSDFMCFQEANDFQIDYLQKLLPDYSVIGQRKPAPKFWQNNVIFHHNKMECIEKQHFFLSHTPDIPSRFQGSRWPRQCTMGAFQIGDRHLICTNSHFDFDAKVQAKSAVLIMNRLSKWPPSIPSILVGDFNASPIDPCYEIFTKKKDANQKMTAFHNSFSDPFQGTHHGFTGKTDGNHIDWILYKGPLEKREAQIIKDDFNGMYPSDHFPLRAIFELKESGFKTIFPEP